MEIGAANRRFGNFDDRVGRVFNFGLWMILKGFLAWTMINEGFHRCRPNTLSVELRSPTAVLPGY
jgi:hypothetical protein